MNDTEILKKVKEWLENEVDTYFNKIIKKEKEYANGVGDFDRFDEGILDGRHECADELLKQIAKEEASDE